MGFGPSHQGTLKWADSTPKHKAPEEIQTYTLKENWHQTLIQKSIKRQKDKQFEFCCRHSALSIFFLLFLTKERKHTHIHTEKRRAWKDKHFFSDLSLLEQICKRWVNKRKRWELRRWQLFMLESNNKDGVVNSAWLQAVIETQMKASW